MGADILATVVGGGLLLTFSGLICLEVFVLAPNRSKIIDDALTDSIKQEESTNSQNRYLISNSGINLRHVGFTAPYELPNCVFLEKKGIPKFLVESLMFGYWESHCHSIGIKLPKSTRKRWNDIHYADYITQKSNSVKFGSTNGKETVKAVHLTTFLAHTGLFSVSGLLVICEHEYDIEKMILKEYRSALFGIISWEETRVEPRNLQNWAIKSISEVFKRKALLVIKEKQSQRAKEDEKRGFLL